MRKPKYQMIKATQNNQIKEHKNLRGKGKTKKRKPWTKYEKITNIEVLVQREQERSKTLSNIRYRIKL